IPETPFVGYLIGIAGNAVESLEWVKKPTAAVEWTGYGVWATESGWAAHIVELGLVGGAFFILFRIILFFRLFGRVVRVALRSDDSLPLLLFSFIGPVILFQQVTTHGTVNGYAWFFLGVVIAACRLVGEHK
ncbi:MAG: hypothetical protein Q8O64_07250, partial [Sideroxyarcus sp.]|nr:hypothetical protein [Sideroxyarcus sp.]